MSIFKRCLLSLAFVFALSTAQEASAATGDTGAVHRTVDTVAVSNNSGYFTFWLAAGVGGSGCQINDRFSIKLNDPNAQHVMDIIKMAFLSGHPVRVWWDGCSGSGTSGAPRPNYIKIYRN